MKIIQTHPTFYVEISNDEIKICTISTVSIYPIWLGKNRSVMRDVVRFFINNPPSTLYDCMDIVGKFGLNGQSCNERPIKEIFTKDEKTIDNDSIFW